MTRRMWDSVTVADIPADAELVAGYLDGHYANLTAMHARFPKDRVVTVTPDGHEGANVDDREPGDQSAVQSAAWATDELKAHRHPAVYVSDSNIKEVLTALALRDAKATLIFTAHWTGKPHICGPACFKGYDLPFEPTVIGTQYADPGTSGGHYDLSLVQDYWPGVDPAPKPKPDPKPHVPGTPLIPATIAAAKAGTSNAKTLIANLSKRHEAVAAENGERDLLELYVTDSERAVAQAKRVLAIKP